MNKKLRVVLMVISLMFLCSPMAAFAKLTEPVYVIEGRTPLYPGTNIFESTIDFNENVTKMLGYIYLDGEPTATGDYRVEITLNFDNPSKWRVIAGAFGIPLLIPEPYNSFEDVQGMQSPSLVYLLRGESITDAMIIICEFQVVSLPCHFEFGLMGNAIITDIDNDGKVNIRDLYLVARNYGKTYEPPDVSEELYRTDVVVDFAINIIDVQEVGYDFGRASTLWWNPLLLLKP